jgi:hypothetical protein
MTASRRDKLVCRETTEPRTKTVQIVPLEKSRYQFSLKAITPNM